MSDYRISRDEAVKLLKEHIKNKNMIKHSYASEAVMNSLAKRLGKDKEKWGLAGLLHDIDVEITEADLNVHVLKTVEILKNKGVDPEIIDAIKMHNEKAHERKSICSFSKQRDNNGM